MSLDAIIALGSNLGDRRLHLEAGLAALRELGSVTPSPLMMETRDESGMGPDYLNTVARLECDLESPCRLLEALLRIELRLGRDRAAGRNAPRTLDLDLIRVSGQTGEWIWPSPEDLRVLGEELTLELPHPRAAGRPFVQEPLRTLSDSDPYP
jgi:2-amino-4-hydroxy-6-hydroxymethyldihydropteridine diphosphokinase